jgi:hypothetical protein
MSWIDRLNRKIHDARLRLDMAAMTLSDEWSGSGSRLAETSEEVENAVLSLGALLLERRRKQGM